MTPVIKIVQPPAIVVRTVPPGTTLLSGSAFVGELTADVEALQAEQITQNTAITAAQTTATAAQTAAATAQTTADGKVSKTGDTMTGDLILPAARMTNSPFPGARIYHPTGGGFLLSSDSAGGVAVAELDATGTFVRSQFYMAKGATSVANFQAHPISAGKPTAAGQVPQLNAYDPVTGRRLVDGREEGDTGWRNVSTLLLNGWAVSGAGRLLLRRIGDIGYFATDITELTPAAATSATFLSLPVGFTGRTAAFQSLGNDFFTTSIRVLGTSVTASTTTGLYRPAGAYVVDAAWPTSLPGTQVTAPYSLPV